MCSPRPSPAKRPRKRGLHLHRCYALCLQLARPSQRGSGIPGHQIFKVNGACLHSSACSAALRQLHRIVAPMETVVQPQREKQHVLCPRALPRVRSGSEYKIIQLCFQLVLSDLGLAKLQAASWTAVGVASSPASLLTLRRFASASSALFTSSASP